MAESAAQVRDDVVAYMRAHHPENCRHWFDTIEAVDFDGGTLSLLVSDRVHLNFLRRQCTDNFTDSAQAVTGRLVGVQFVDEKEAESIRRQKATRGSNGVGRAIRSNGAVLDHPDQMPLHPDYTFENFIVGPGNQMAHAAAVAVAQKPGQAYNPLFIHGGVGLGKTHLVQAICREIQRNYTDGEPNIYYISCGTFINRFLEAVQAGDMADFRHRFRNVDVLMIDDIHFLSNHDRTQEEFFHTFNTLFQAGKQIVLSSDAPPREIPRLEERLMSRFSSGLVERIVKPDFETRVAIVRKKAMLRSMPIADDVATFIANSIDTNIRELEGAITKLHIFSRVNKAPINLELARAALGEQLPRTHRQPSPQQIIEVVIEYFDVKLTDLLSKRRHKSITLPRQVCMYLARKLTRYSLEEIGGYFGGRDHTTVLHAIKTIERKRKTDSALDDALTHLEAKLTEKPA